MLTSNLILTYTLVTTTTRHIHVYLTYILSLPHYLTNFQTTLTLQEKLVAIPVAQLVTRPIITFPAPFFPFLHDTSSILTLILTYILICYPVTSNHTPHSTQYTTGYTTTTPFISLITYLTPTPPPSHSSRGKIMVENR